MNTVQPFATHRWMKLTGNMRSPRGFFAALTLLLTLPLALLGQALFGINPEITLHFLLALATGLAALAVFDFGLPRWIIWLGCALSGAVTTIFLLQGSSLLIPNQELSYLAYQVLGQQLESALVDGMIFWFIAPLLWDSQGKTRLFGIAAISIFVCSELYRNALMYLGGEPADFLKLSLLPPFVWLLLESAKRRVPGK